MSGLAQGRRATAQGPSTSQVRSRPGSACQHAGSQNGTAQPLLMRRARTFIPMRIPADVVESLKDVAPMRGFSAYQTLLTSDISERLRREEVQFEQNTAQRLAAALKRRGVAAKVLQEAMRELAQSD